MNNKKKAFTLIEIIISLLIISLTVAGLTSVFITGQRFIVLSAARMQAVNVARGAFDSLNLEVDARTWDQAGLNRLNAGWSDWTIITVNIGDTFVTYTFLWTVDAIGNGIRRVRSTTWWSLP